MKKLKFMFKLAITLSFVGAIFVVVVMGEGTFGQDAIKEAALSKGLSVPLKEPKIMVDISDMTLSLYDGEVLIKRYDAASGHSPRRGVLLRAGGSTPLGEYTVTHKSKDESFLTYGSRFLEIDFPNEDDVEQALDSGEINQEQYDAYYRAKEAGARIPEALYPNGRIGIQGNYYLFSSSKSTEGGIALSNRDLNELYEYVPIGTTVSIAH